MSEFNMTQLDQDIDTLRDVYMTNSQREVLARVQALASYHARLQADADRYCKLRTALLDNTSECWESFVEQPEPTNADDFDAAIDAAKAVQP